MDLEIDAISKRLDEAKHIAPNGVEYWHARELQEILGYSSWDNFAKVIEKAQMACDAAKISSRNQIHETVNLVTVGSGAQYKAQDFILSRYACYLIAMNGNPQKAEIAAAQTYFAVQTRRQEAFDKQLEEEPRIQLRDRVRIANRRLSGVAKKSGVQEYALFHDAGYRGLYGMGLRSIKAKKGIDQKEDLLDRAGRAELAANEFRITQTEQKILRENIQGDFKAQEAHREVGQEVRTAIRKIGGTMPEDLPAEASIKKLKSKKQQELPSHKE
jgi:DNA-damage-inducible protein D